jgi:hypothetical protein
MPRVRSKFSVVLVLAAWLGGLGWMDGGAAAQVVASGSEFQVNAFTGGPVYNSQRDTALACDAVGDFVVAWEGPSTTGFGRTVFHQRFEVAPVLLRASPPLTDRPGQH